MNERSTIARYSLSQIEALRERGPGTSPDPISPDSTSPEAPKAESLGAEFWSSARVVMPRGRTSVHLRLDSDVVEWFKAGGKGHVTRMNTVLRAYVDAHPEPPRRTWTV